MRGPFRPGDRVLLVDAKSRTRMIELEAGGIYHLHTGTLDHDDLIGADEGSEVRTSLGQRLVAWRPTLSEYVVKMKRGAQVIYPKDIGPILLLADVQPGDFILESGVGSGALSTALLRAVGPRGRILGYELREDFARRATRNIEGWFGAPLGSEHVPMEILLRDCYEGILPEDLGGRPLDKVILDLPEPWQIVKHAQDALRPGGIFVAYLPTVGQVARLAEVLEGSRFAMVQTLEVLQRTWHVKEPSARPDHRMVAHTGFLTHARLRAPAGSPADRET